MTTQSGGMSTGGKSPGVLASLQHIGRRSGQEYVTPVLAVPFGDGFVVPLASGRSVDWFRNVMVAHGCKLVWKKQEYLLEKPEVLTLAQTQHAYPWPIRWIFFAGGVSHHVFLHRANRGSEIGSNS